MLSIYTVYSVLQTMPKKINNIWKVDIRPNGREGPRFRKNFNTRAEATRYENHILSVHKDFEPWEKPKRDNRRLSELVDIWYELHGQHLKKGERRLSEFTNLIKTLGDPVAKKLTANDFAKARALRLKTVSTETVNRDLTNLCSVYNELRRLKEIDYPNPLTDLKKLAVKEKLVTFLSLDQITILLSELDKHTGSHAYIQARIALSTGARWGETIVDKNQISNEKISFVDTKNGKVRTVPIEKDLENLIQKSAPIIDGLNTFKRAIKATNIELPKGQMTHVLRHTFASHFMINGGNIITLQRILGHGSIMMTMRYAHLSPDHLNEAKQLNPLNKLGH